jgi:glycosyltransferase involved in cell wall biosynthesis
MAARSAAVDTAGCVARLQRSRRPYDSPLVRVAFLLQDIQLSGGVGVVVEHASQLNRHHGFDARVVLTRPNDELHWDYRGLRDVPIMSLEEARAERFDVATATWWETASVLFQLRADRYAYFLQLLEDSTYAPDAPERLAASLTTALPVRFITEARWIADTVARLQPGNRALYVRNGIAKDTFRSPPEPPPADGPLRIVIEGSRRLAHKGVDDALAAVRLMREPRHVTLVTPHRPDGTLEGVDAWLSGLTHPEMAEVLLAQHVMLKLARVEGMYGPPLEAFHMGATCVTTPVTGFDEYVRDGWNGIVVGWDDLHGTARALDLLARDRERLHFLRRNALLTARTWPSSEQSSRVMAIALRAVHREPTPNPRAAGVRLASDFATTLAEGQRQAWLVSIQEAIVDDLKSQKAWQLAVSVRERYHRARAPFGLARRRLRRLIGR